MIALLHPAASESELRRSGDSWHELGVHQGYRGKHRSGKHKIGDQLSLVHTGTIWYCILLRWLNKGCHRWLFSGQANRQATALAARSTGCTGSDKVQIQNCHHSFGWIKHVHIRSIMFYLQSSYICSVVLIWFDVEKLTCREPRPSSSSPAEAARCQRASYRIYKTQHITKYLATVAIQFNACSSFSDRTDASMWTHITGCHTS